MASKKQAGKGKATSGGSKKTATARKPARAKPKAKGGAKKKAAKAQPKKKGKATQAKAKPAVAKKGSSGKPSASKKSAQKTVVQQKTARPSSATSAAKKSEKPKAPAAKVSERSKEAPARGKSAASKAKPERKSGVHEIPQKKQKVYEARVAMRKKEMSGEPLVTPTDSSPMTPPTHPTRKRRPEASLSPAKPRAAKSTSSGEAKVSAAATPESAPSFRLKDQSGAEVDSSGLKGKPYVLYFYPKDDTPGCTREACDFRDSFGRFQSRGIPVFGVSPDSTQSHGKFAQKYELPFRLLADPEKTLTSAYGAWALKNNYGKEYMGVVRSTFLIGADGKIKKTWRNVKVDGHVAQVLAEAEQLGA